MKNLTKQELQALIEILSPLGPVFFDDYDISINQGKNKVTIEITEKDYKGQFEEYLKTLDDDVFIAACEYYKNNTGQDLSKIKDITPEIIGKFKQIVKIVVRERIYKLQQKYGC